MIQNPVQLDAKQDKYRDSRISRYLSECIGTYVLVLAMGSNVISGNYVWGFLSVGGVYMAMIYALRSGASSEISPGYFNPAVSLALGACCRLEMTEALIYSALQMLGGCLGALSFAVLFWQDIFFAPMVGVKTWEAGAAEMLYTFMLCFVALNCGSKLRTQYCISPLFGVAIALVVVAGGYGAGAISGGCFNPAVAVSIDLSSAGTGFGWGLAYAGFDLIGAAVACIAFRLCRPDEFCSEVKKVAGVQLTELLTEFIGTFFVVLTMGLNKLADSPAGALSVAAAVLSMVIAVGDASVLYTAHFNPAVTLSAILAGRPRMKPKPLLMASQCAAGVCAACVYRMMSGLRSFTLGTEERYSWGTALFLEVLFTCLLCLAVLSTQHRKGMKAAANHLAAAQKKEDYDALAMFAVVLGAGFAIDNASGGVLNPAAALGITITGGLNLHTFLHFLVYVLFEFLGGTLAAGIFRLLYRDAYN